MVCPSTVTIYLGEPYRQRWQSLELLGTPCPFRRDFLHEKRQRMVTAQLSISALANLCSLAEVLA
jgi:hypothetical protein